MLFDIAIENRFSSYPADSISHLIRVFNPDNIILETIIAFAICGNRINITNGEKKTMKFVDNPLYSFNI